MQPTKLYASFFHFSAKSREVFLLVKCARIRRGPSVTYISGSAPRICSSNDCVVKFVAHQLHMVIKGEYLLILFPFFLSCFLSFIFSHFQIHLKTFFFFFLTIIPQEYIVKKSFSSSEIKKSSMASPFLTRLSI